MKIPSNLHQFAEPALLVAAGKQSAAILKARNGSIERMAEVKVKKPVYTDKEGQFKKRGRGGTMSSGSVREARDDEIVRAFVSALKEKIRSFGALSEIREIYVFAPPQSRPRVLSAFGAREQELIKAIFDGNHVRVTPLSLVKMISESQSEKKITPTDSGARRILSIPESRAIRR